VRVRVFYGANLFTRHKNVFAATPSTVTLLVDLQTVKSPSSSAEDVDRVAPTARSACSHQRRRSW
jgi:hypothetical protein